MGQDNTTDGQLHEWGSRLFWGRVKGKGGGEGGVAVAPLAQAMLAMRTSATDVRTQIRDVVAGRGKQVVVKITGGGRGMTAIQAHMRYISRQGKEIVGGRGETLEMEDELGRRIKGKDAIKELAEDWRLAGTYIHDDSRRKEAFNIMLSMPEGTPPEIVQRAARQFAHETFNGHKFVFVLHTDTKSPHVHLTVRAERCDGVRLNPRKEDLQRWRERFAARLQEHGVNALATPARARGVERAAQPLWRQRAPEREVMQRKPVRTGGRHEASMSDAREAWRGIERALSESSRADDQVLAKAVAKYIREAFQNVKTTGERSRRPATRTPQTSRTLRREKHHGDNTRVERPGLGSFERVYGAERQLARGTAGARWQLDAGGAAGAAQAKDLDSVRGLSGIHVASFGSERQVLLQGDARLQLGQRKPDAADALRRPVPDAQPIVEAQAGGQAAVLSDRELEQALRSARQKHGQRLHVNGDEAFKERVAKVVAATGMDIQFSDERLNARVDELVKARGRSGPER